MVMEIQKYITLVSFLFIGLFTAKTYCQFDSFGGFSPFNPKASPQDNSLVSGSKQTIGNDFNPLVAGNNGNDANSDLLKQVNQQDSGMGNMGNNLLEGQDDQSVRELLKSFQTDDTTGNYLHKGDHNGYGETQGAFQEEVLKHEVENPGARDAGTAFNSPTLEVTKEVELIIQSGSTPLGRILIGLFGNTVPKTVANFVDLADHKVTDTLYLCKK